MTCNSSGDPPVGLGLAMQPARPEVGEGAYRALYEDAPLPYQSLDAAGRLIAVNRAWLHMLGYERDEVLGRSLADFAGPEWAPLFPEAFKEFRSTGVIKGREAVLRHRTGASVRVKAFGRVVRDADGGFVRTHCILQDITKQREAEERARRVERVYERIVETSQEGIWVADARLVTTFANPRLCAILGYTAEEMVGKPIADFIAPDEMGDHAARMSLRRAGVAERYVRRLVRKDGETCALLISATPLLDANGEFEGTCAMLSDITGSEERELALVEAQRKTASILRAAPVGIGMLTERVFREVNDAFCAMLGYSREEIVGRGTRMIYPTDEEYERVGSVKYEQIRRTGSGTIQTRFRRKDGAVLDVVLNSSIVDPARPENGVTFTALDISDLKRTERALLDALGRWRLTFDSVPDLVCVLDTDRRIVSANKAMADRLGVRPEDLVGRLCYEVMHDLGAPPDWCPFDEADGEGTRSVDMVEPRLGGASSVSVTKITDTAGAVVGFVHVIRDLTVRIESERDVRRSRDFLDCVINAVADPVFVKDSAHRWVLLNDAECALTSRTREEMLGKTDHDFFPADQADAFWAKDDEVLGTGLVNRVVEELTDSSGSDRVLLTTKARHIDPDGQPLIVGISKDITDLVRAEKELRQSRARLESLYRLATTTFESDQELMAFALEEVVRLTESEFAYAHFMNRDQVDLELFAWSRRAFEVCTAPVDRKYPLADAGVWADCARIGRPVIHNDYGTLPKRQGYPEGHVPIRSHMSVPVLDGNQVVMIAGVANREGPYYETDAHDFQLYMTEVWHLLRRREAEFQLRESRRSLEDEVKRRTRQLEATVEELDAFAYSVSHDLMAPVRHMDQFGSFLHEDYGSTLGEDGRQLVERIRGGARRMGVLIQALLDLSRTSRAELRRGEVDIGEVALRVVEELRAEHPGRAVAVEIEAGLAASCDAELAAILLRNLLGNAWKFTSETADARIEVGRADGEGGPRFFVRDNGAGFDAERAPRLFTAFQRFHSEGEFPGTGIGLATARRIVRRHGGDIRAESTPGLGATFYFTLEE